MRNLDIGTDVDKVKIVNDDTPLSKEYEKLLTDTVNQFVVILRKAGDTNRLMQLRVIYNKIPEKLTVKDIYEIYCLSQLMCFTSSDIYSMLHAAYEPIRKVSVDIQYYNSYYKFINNYSFMDSYLGNNKYYENTPNFETVKKYTN